MEKLGYRPELDGLRAVAILLVLVYHASEAFAVADVIPAGFLGVDLFFVLSGFLITSIVLDQAGRVGWVRRFYARRVRRLLPALLAVLVAVSTVAAIAGAWGQVAGSVAANVGYVANWVPGSAVALQHTWSLAIEEQFYLVWPVVCALAVRRFGRENVAVGVLALVLVVVWWRSQLVADAGSLEDLAVVYRRTDARADGLLIGSALALVGAYRWRVPRVAAAFAGGVLGATALTLSAGSLVLYRGWFTVIAVCAAVLVAWTVQARPGWLRFRPLVRVGVLSYGLYLWHYPIYWAVSQVIVGPLGVALGVSGAFMAAAVSARWIERPFRSDPVADDHDTRTTRTTRGGTARTTTTAGVRGARGAAGRAPSTATT